MAGNSIPKVYIDFSDDTISKLESIEQKVDQLAVSVDYLMGKTDTLLAKIDVLEAKITNTCINNKQALFYIFCSIKFFVKSNCMNAPATIPR